MRRYLLMGLACVGSACVTTGPQAPDFTGGPLPPYSQSGSVLAYTEALIDGTTANERDKPSKVTRIQVQEGYSSTTGAWCLQHETVRTTSDVRDEYSSLCKARNGFLANELCMDTSNIEKVHFAVRVWTDRKCRSGVPYVFFVVAEPTFSSNHLGYISMLRQFGYETIAEIDARLKRETELREEEAKRAQERKKAVLASGEGTRICRPGIFSYFLNASIASERQKPGHLIAQLDGLSEDRTRLRFRVLGYDIPSLDRHEVIYSHSHRMDEFRASPGTVYWDRVENWSLCE